ncbi:hypothetical protein U1707_16840 [Sphingomonas sp. PB2P12]
MRLAIDIERQFESGFQGSDCHIQREPRLALERDLGNFATSYLNSRVG